MARHLSLRHFEMLIAISRSATQADAARSLLITPSALTHRIREAERRLGVLLYEKQGRGLRPTLAGRILSQTAARVLEDVQQSERVAISSARGIRHVVRLSVAVYAAFHWLPAFLPWFRKAHPGIELEIDAQAAQNPFDALSRGLIDLVISPDLVLPGQLDAVDLFEDELVAVVPPGHRLAARDWVSGSDFLDDPYLTYSLVRQPGYEADRLWTPENVLPPREENIGSVDAICELIKAGFGISILSHWAIHPQFQSRRLVPVRATAEGLGLTWRAITKSGAREGAPELLLAGALADWFQLNPPAGILAQAARPSL